MKNPSLGSILLAVSMASGCIEPAEQDSWRAKMIEPLEELIGKKMPLHESCISEKDQGKIRKIREDIQNTCKAMRIKNCTDNGNTSGLTLGVAEVNETLSDYGCTKSYPWYCSPELDAFGNSYCAPNDLNTDVYCPTACTMPPEMPPTITETYSVSR